MWNNAECKTEQDGNKTKNQQKKCRPKWKSCDYPIYKRYNETEYQIIECFFDTQEFTSYA